MLECTAAEDNILRLDEQKDWRPAILKNGVFVAAAVECSKRRVQRSTALSNVAMRKPGIKIMFKKCIYDDDNFTKLSGKSKRRTKKVPAASNLE